MLTLEQTVHDPADQFRRGWSTSPRHSGIDYGWQKPPKDTARSKENLAAAPGRVVSVYSGDDYNGGWGRRVVIEVTDRVRIAYSHFASILVYKGQIVDVGALLGAMGSTGAATGDHQHFELYIDGVRVNPAPYLAGKPLPGTPVVTPEQPAGTGATGLRQRTVKPGVAQYLRGRTQPSTKSGVVKQELRPGVVGNFDAFRRGQKVTVQGTTSDVWFRGAFNGNWFAAAGFTSQSTAGLRDLGTYTEPRKPAKQKTFKTPPRGQFYYRTYGAALSGTGYVKTALPGGKTYTVTNNPKTGPVQISVPGIGLVWVGTRNHPAKVS